MDLTVGMQYNSLTRLRKFLGCTPEEIVEFMESLTPEERKEWREADLYE